MRPWSLHPGCQPSDNASLSPTCRKCGTVAQPVRDSSGPHRYDCPSCIVRFDLSRFYSSLETEGLSPSGTGTQGYRRLSKGHQALAQRKRCGKTGTRLVCTGCVELTYVPYRCGTRICADCARRQADKLYFETLHALRTVKSRPGDRLRHLTLTIKGPGYWNPQAISDGLKVLSAALPRFYRDYLRREPFSVSERRELGLDERHLIDDLSLWRKRPVLKDDRLIRITKQGKTRPLDRTGLLAAFEIGPNGNLHVHCLYYGPFRWQEEISAVWRRLTGSYIVWVRAIEDRKKAIREITKYVVKFSEFPESRLIELADLLDPFRRVRAYGRFYGVKSEEEASEPCCWACGEQDSLRVEEREIPAERWCIEFAQWQAYRARAETDVRVG